MQSWHDFRCRMNALLYHTTRFCFEARVHAQSERCTKKPEKGNLNCRKEEPVGVAISPVAMVEQRSDCALCVRSAFYNRASPMKTLCRSTLFFKAAKRTYVAGGGTSPISGDAENDLSWDRKTLADRVRCTAIYVE